MALMEEYPTIDIESVGLKQLTGMILALPAFYDDPRLVTNQILIDIQTIWYEEATIL
jgi:FeS assembly protein IscX